jgi:hypothetical protein
MTGATASQSSWRKGCHAISMAPNALGHFEVLYEAGGLYEDTENEKVRFPNLIRNSPERAPPDDVFQSIIHKLNEGIFQCYLVFL